MFANLFYVGGVVIGHRNSDGKIAPDIAGKERSEEVIKVFETNRKNRKKKARRIIRFSLLIFFLLF